MKRILFFPCLVCMAIIFQSCGDSEEGSGSGIDGTWRLSQITVNLDNTQLTQFPVSGPQTTFSSDSFSYNDGGSRSGTWEISEDETMFSVGFEGNNASFPIISKSDTEIIIEVKTLDLSTTPDQEAQGLIALTNQKLAAAGNSWKEASAQAQSASFLFTITK